MAEKPATPDEGKPADAATEDVAADAKAEVAEEKAAEAAEATEAEEPAAEADADAEKAEEKPKPKRRRTAKKAEPKAEKEEADAKEEPTAEETADKAKPDEVDKPKRRRRGGEATAGQTRRTPRREPGEQVFVRAKARYVHHAPRKARLVVDHIRGKSVDEARAILIHTPRAASRDVLKLLDSAIANAENNHELVADELTIHQAFVDEGPTLKRFRPRALGRATRIRKRTSHMTILLTTKE
jgi:ribosomal protein L22